MKDTPFTDARLLSLYDRVAEAENAIPRLRRFVLDLAVRGKLVPQEAGDEPASMLLEQIEKEKARLVQDGAIKARAANSVSSTHPDNAPSGWKLTEFGNIAEFYAGRTPPRGESEYWNNGDFSWVSIADMEDGQVVTSTKETVSSKAAEKVFRCAPEPVGTIIMSFKLTIGKIARLGIPAFHNEAIITIKPHLADLDPYLFLVLPELARGGDTKGAIKGATLNRDSLTSILVPLPPLAEQHRIVAKVEELMALLDQLEAARAKREETRTRLTVATLSRLTEANADTPTAARFALQTLPALTTRPDQIKTLRQTILNLAVRGKLVEQDSRDEPAAVLLKSIGREIVRRRQEMGLRRQEPLEPVNLNDEPFQLPHGWTWARFPEVGVFARGKSKHRPRNDTALYLGGNIPFVQTGDVARSNGKIETYTSSYNAKGLEQSMLWPAGTMCITIAANIADSGILTFDACFPDSVVGLLVASPFPNARFFEYFVRTAKANLTEYAPATAQKNINLGILETVLIPLPPLAEQHRIVAKVEELMSLCDRLERALQDATTTRARLLDATLRDALSGAQEAA